MKSVSADVQATTKQETFPQNLQLVSIWEHSVADQKVTFAVSNPNDHIQRHHTRGTFYEAEELDKFLAHYSGGTYVDIGANVGNHVIFAAKFGKADRIVPFEANPPAIMLLKMNVALNDLNTIVNLNYVGKIVSDRSGDRFGFGWRQNNLGGARPVQNSGQITSITGDAALEHEQVAYIKIDVEGGEIDVLKGLEKTVHRDRPKLFIEVDDKNLSAFEDWMTQNSYVVEDRHRRYRHNENLFISPR